MKDFSDENSISIGTPKISSITKINFRKQRIRARIPTSSVVALRTLLLEFPFNESLSYRAVEDYDCWLRIHRKIEFSLKLMEPLLFYRNTEGQISGSKKEMARKVFMVHANFPGSGYLSASIFTLTHILGGIYFRFIKGEL